MHYDYIMIQMVFHHQNQIKNQPNLHHHFNEIINNIKLPPLDHKELFNGNFHEFHFEYSFKKILKHLLKQLIN